MIMRKFITILLAAALPLVMSGEGTVGKSRAASGASGNAEVLPARTVGLGQAPFFPQQRPVTPFRTAMTVNTPVVRPPLMAIPHTSPHGVLIANSSWAADNPLTGEYEFSPYAFGYKPLLLNRGLGTTNGLCHFEDYWWVTVYENVLGMPFISSAIYNASTGEMLAQSNRQTNSARATSMVYDADSKLIYGCFLGETSGYNLGTINTSTFEYKTIGALTEYLFALAITPQGQMVAIGGDTGTLFKVNTRTAMLTPVGATGLTSKYATSGAIDPYSGRYYYATCNDAGGDNALYTVSLADGKATKLYDFVEGEEIMGMWVPQPPHADKAPGAAAEMSVTPVGGTLDVDISIKAPKLFFDESTGTGSLTLTLTDGDGAAIVDAEAIEWGAERTVRFTAPVAGEYSFTAVFSTDGGKGPETTVSRFIGGVRPAAVEAVTVTPGENGVYSISWTPVTTALDEGDFNAADVTYTLRRTADSKVLATGLTTTSYTDTYPEPAKLTRLGYAVTPVYAGTEGAETASETTVTGYITPAFTENFSKSRADYVALWTIVDADGNGAASGWTHDSSAGRIRTKGGQDDIMASPRIYLETDKVYTLSFGVSSYSSSKTAIVGAAISESLDADGFSTIIEPQTVQTASKTVYETLSTTVKVDRTGFYHIGIVDAGGTGTYNYVDNFKIEAPKASGAPAAPQLQVTTDRSGELKASIAVTLPEKNAGGKALTSITKLIVKRDDSTVATVTENLTPGSTVTLTDDIPQAGPVVYKAVAVNEAGQGAAARTEVFAGVNRPGAVTDVVMTEEPSEGEVTIRWKAPLTDVDGYPLNPSGMTYTVYGHDAKTVVAERLTAPEFTCRVTPEGQRDLALYWIRAVTSAGPGDAVVPTGLRPVGRPYVVPLKESFAAANVNMLMATQNLTPMGDARWVMTPGSDEVPPQDGDGGFAMFLTSYANQSSRLSTGKIHIPDASTRLTFHYFAIPGNENTLEVEVGTPVDFKTVATVCLGETGKQGWTKVTVPLGDYQDKDISIGFRATSVNSSQVHLDNITVATPNARDVAVTQLSVPSRMVSDKSSQIDMTIENIGLENASGVQVVLFANGEEVARAAVSDIAPEAAYVHTFAYTPSASGGREITFRAEAQWDADQNGDDNVSQSASAVVEVPQYPMARDFSGTVGGDGVIALSWQQPAPSEATPIVEDVETLTPFATGMPGSVVENEYLGAWTMADVDGAHTYGIDHEGATVEFPNMNSPMAFMVFAPALTPMASEKVWASGDGSEQYFVSLCAINARNDDWLITPRLSGEAQTLSLSARSIADGYHETFEVLVSSTGTRPDDFTSIAVESDIASEWTTYTYDLPEGTLYAAIRNIANDQFILMVDNIAFAAYKPFGDLTLLGYNLYRDGVRLNSAPLTALDYADAAVEEGETYSYSVSAVYDAGESRLSSPLTLVSVKNAIDSPSRDAAFSVRSVPGAVEIRGASGRAVKVYTPSGLLVADISPAAAVETVRLMSGIYIVACDGRAVATAVR